MTAQPNYHDDEIDLRDYINVLIKRKATIISVFLVCVIFAAVYSFSAPEVYEVSQILAPPETNFQNYLISPIKIAERIDEGLYTRAIRKTLELPQQENIKIETAVFSEDGFFKTKVKASKGNIEKAKSILSVLYDKLKKEFALIIDAKKSKIENNIFLKRNQMKRKEEQIESSKKKISLIEERILFMENQSTKAKENTDILVKERTSFLDEVANENRISSVLYTTTIQQAIGYFNQLHNQLNLLKSRRENLETTIKMLRGKIEDIEIRINELDIDQKFIHNIRQIEPPLKPENPISPKKKQNIAIAGVLGLMLGVFIAFFREFWVNSAKGEDKG